MRKRGTSLLSWMRFVGGVNVRGDERSRTSSLAIDGAVIFVSVFVWREREWFE